MGSKSNKETAAEMGAVGLIMVLAVLIIKFGLWAVLGIGLTLMLLSFYVYQGK